MINYQRVNLHFPMVFLWFSYGFPSNKTHVTTIPIGIMFGSSSGSSCGLAAWPCLAWLEMQPRIAGQQTEAVSLVALVRSQMGQLVCSS